MTWHAVAITSLAFALPLTAWLVGRAVLAWQVARGRHELELRSVDRIRHADVVVERLAKAEQDIQSLANKVALKR